VYQKSTVNIHPRRNAHRSGATRGTMPSFRFTVFKTKFPTNMSCSIAHANVFLWKTQTCKKEKMLNCARVDVTAHSKLWVPTPPRLRCKDLRAWSRPASRHPTTFKKYSGNRLGSGLKQLLRKMRKSRLNLPKCSGAANAWRCFVAKVDQAF
jgi:hypothetical protein